MNKYFIVTVIVAIMPSAAFAAWWNPATWFQSSESVNTSSDNPPIIQEAPSSSEQTITPAIIPTVATTSSDIAAPMPAPTSPSPSDESSLKSRISSLISANDSLQEKLTSTMNQLAIAQNNVSMCQNKLTIAASQNINQQSQPVATTPVSPPLTKSSASMVLDHNSPTSATFTSNGQYSDIPALIFDVNPSGDNLLPHSLSLSIISAGNNNSGQNVGGTVHLYQGKGANMTPIGTAIISNGVATFSQIANTNTSPIDVGLINAFTVTVTASLPISVSISSFTLIDSAGNIVDVTGTVNGNTITASNI